MAFRRNTLKAMGLSDEQVESVIELHTETVNALKADIDKFRDDSEKLSEVKEKLDKAQKELETVKKDDYKTKYESEKAAHDKLKADIATNETKAKKAGAFKSMLKDKGYSENAINKITKYGGFVEGVELDEEGKINNPDKLLESIEAEWSEYKPQAGTARHTPVTPPAGGKVTKTKDDIMKIEDAAERRQAIAENIELFK